MASELPTDSFWDLLRQSGLVSDSQILALRAEFGQKTQKSDSSRGLADELVRRGILTDWQADNLLQGKHRGFRLGPYRILKPLGQGGMSRVFLGEHEMMHRRCAIKVLPSKYQEDPDLLSRFQLEARAVGALDHPHIVRAYDFNKDVRYGKEIHYLVMEFVDGQDLRRMVDKQGPLDCRKAADFIAQAAEGLAHAHAAGFVHRDIKPANLLVDNNGVLKILDLGLARFTFEGDNPWETLEADPSAVGTADYVPPEQVADPRSVDGRSDIYSLGLTFYYLLTGRRPFPKPTLMDVLMAHRSEQPEPIIDLRPDVPFDLIAIVDRMIAKSPLQRYQTANEVAEALHHWLDESASGGGYSRISELMAAAMRSRQPSPESKSAKSARARAETSELELAALDDAPAAAKAVEGERSRVIRGAATQQKPKKAAVGESGGMPVVKRSASDSKRSLTKSSSDVFSDLFPAELTAPHASGPLPTHRPWKRQPAWQSALMSPWFWAGLVLVLVVILAIWTAWSSESGAPKRPRGKSVPTLARNGASQKQPSASTSPSPKAAATQKPAAESPKPPVEPPKPAVEPPKPAVQKPAEALPAAPITEADRALAGLTRLRVTLGPNYKDSRNIYLISVIRRQVIASLSQLKIALTQDNLPVLQLTLNVSVSDPNRYVVDISAQLSIAGPNGQRHAVWKQSRTAINVPSQDVPEQRIQEAMRAGMADFFGDFAKAVREAREKVHGK
ncbi:MAG: protein kinase [Thermoguttaceae bacterium]